MEEKSKTNKKNILILSLLAVLIIAGIFVFITLLPKNKEKNVYLVANTNKTEYLVGETVKIEMAKVDKDGNADCDANLKLTINGINKKDIVKSSACKLGINIIPDYLFSFKPDKTGTFKIKLKDLDTKVTATRYFDVVSEKSLDITRKMDLKINLKKGNTFPVRIHVKANKDYSGEISDLVPNGITIKWQGEAKVEGNKITWHINLKAGETKYLMYEYSVNSPTPTTYSFGEDKDWTIITTNQEQKMEIKIPEIIKKLNEKNN